MSDARTDLLKYRYFRRDESGRLLEDENGMWYRIGSHVASAEKTDEDRKKWEKIFINALTDRIIIPNTPCIANAGTDVNMNSACFSMQIDDSIESIMNINAMTAKVFKDGGGVGFNFKNIRERGSTVGNTRRLASGVISWMRIYNQTCEEVKQGGLRRGAMIGILPINHPEIQSFIKSKIVDGELRNFNISVIIDKDFMIAKENDEEIDLISPKTKKSVGKVRARELWDMLCQNAYYYGDPGVLFKHNMNRDNPIASELEIDVCNPCGEIPMFPFESCNLCHVNLLKCISYDKKTPYFDFKLYKKYNEIAVRFLDNLIEVSNFPYEIIEKNTKRFRRIGVGLSGLADLFYVLKMRYGSKESIALCEEIGRSMKQTCYEYSERLAIERGVFPAYDEFKLGEKGVTPRRNICVNTIAPTGATSIILECSSAIEPHSGPVHYRTIEFDHGPQTYKIVNEIFVDDLKKRGLYSEELLDQVLRDGSVQNTNLPDDMKEVYVTWRDITWRDQLNILKSFAPYIDNGISKTVLLPQDVDPKVISDIYEEAEKSGLKGITIYRDGSRKNQPINLSKDEKKEVANNVKITKAPEVARGIRRRFRNPDTDTTYYIWFSFDEDGRCVEVFVINDGAKPEEREINATITRQISLALTHGVPLEEVMTQLDRSYVDENNKMTVTRMIYDTFSKIISVQSGQSIEDKELEDNIKGVACEIGCKSCQLP